MNFCEERPFYCVRTCAPTTGECNAVAGTYGVQNATMSDIISDI